ncbi:MTRF1L release factor glutamine methyltransferase isoform X1 [Oncorhynchus tshawytscha]|uniref:peptide chain release factor N(5)-glutamine methyltransferase n=2 Tax=Oncorhynchus tshawytscha TaxID=74940 RepID=A0A8C8JK35_ONCTS|nr:MTRF1L release factor glutamine methyltransferase isoform X1 [Oncorhynchus tshawytscha]
MIEMRKWNTMWIRLRRPLKEVYNCFKPLKDGFIGHKWLCTSPSVAECVPALPTASRLTVEQAVKLWTGHFQQRGVSEPHLSSQYIIAHLLGAKTLEGIGQDRLAEFLTQEQTEQTWELCSRRLTRMPVQYVIEEWDFRDLTLKMRPPVFIPRPETEELVGLVLTDLQMKQGTGLSEETSFRCLEVGCGSGAISLSLLKSLPQLRAIALDKNKDAVDLTRENSHSLGFQDRLEVHHMDVMRDADIIVSMCSPVSVLVSNPPYLFSEDMISLEPEILRFEDHAALDGGKDGMQVMRHILTLAPKLLSNHGRVYLEVDPRHPQLIQQWVEESVEELHYLRTHRDITDRPRFCILQKKECNTDQDQH